MNNSATRTVFKLGGSLLHQPNWSSRLRSWLNSQPPGEYFGVVGGGRVIGAMRELDEQHKLSQEEMHWRCIRMLDATYEIAAELMPDAYRIGSRTELQPILGTQPRVAGVRPFWVRVSSFYSPESVHQISTDVQPKIGWNTTSDCLALLLAYLMGAHRCVLLKSCSVVELQSLVQAVEKGIVDLESLRFQVAVPSIELVQL